LGIFADVGLWLTIVGTIVTIVFGLTASTRSSLRNLRHAVVPRLDHISVTVDRIADTLTAVRQALDERPPRASISLATFTSA
jgi:hypothetical protein